MHGYNITIFQVLQALNVFIIETYYLFNFQLIEYFYKHMYVITSKKQ